MQKSQNNDITIVTYILLLNKNIKYDNKKKKIIYAKTRSQKQIKQCITGF